MRNGLTTIQDGLDKSLKLLHSKVMPDGAMAIAIEYKDEIVVTRIYLTDLVGFLHQQKTMQGYVGGPDRIKLRMEMISKDYYVMAKEKYNELTYHQLIPQYNSLQLGKR